MLKHLFVCAVAGLTLAASVDAASIVWGAGINNGFSLSTGTELSAGSLIRLGYFNVSDSVVIANKGNVSFLNSNFVEAASARIGEGIPGSPASNFSAESVVNTSALNIEGKQMFLWAFASGDNSSVTASVNSAFEIGVFYLGNASWLFPDQANPGTTEIDLTDLTDGTNTVLSAGAQILIGNFPNGASTIGGAPNFGLAVVPEPATAGLALVGGVALLLRRRRY